MTISRLADLLNLRAAQAFIPMRKIPASEAFFTMIGIGGAP